MRGRQRLAWFSLWLLGLIFVSASAYAASSGTNLTTSPITLDLNIKPGTSVTKTLQLLNNGPNPLPINMILDEFGPNGKNGEPTIIPPPANDTTPSWVSFSPKNFVAQPGVWSSVTMTINLPKTAQLGYYLTAVFSPNLTVTKGSRSNTIKGSNGILVLIDTGSANEQRLANIAKFSVIKGLYEYLPTDFTVSIHNSGNIFLAPYGNIFISRSAAFTSSMASISINSNGGNVLPKSSRNFTGSWNDGFPVYVNKTLGSQPLQDKKGNPIKQLNWNFSHADKFRFGKYYAKLTLIYNNGQRTLPLTSVVSFWVIPWKLIIIFLVVIGIAGIGVFTLGRNFIRRIIRLGKRWLKR